MNKDKNNLMSALETNKESVLELLRDYAIYGIETKTSSGSIEKILIKLNNLSSDLKKKYWGAMLVVLIQGLDKMQNEIIEQIMEEVHEFNKQN